MAPSIIQAGEWRSGRLGRGHGGFGLHHSRQDVSGVWSRRQPIIPPPSHRTRAEQGLIRRLFSFCSDGTTPEEQTKQILNVTAILPGQTVDRRFSIPERKCDPAPQNQTDDLIDFGQNDEPAKRPRPGSVERKDSDTNSIDEFVDAES